MAKNIATETFTSSGSWTAPAGVTYVTVRMSGGGAGGQEGTDAEDGSQFGVQGGASPERIFTLTVVPATSYTVTIGAGGVAGTSSVIAGDGSDTTFGSLATAIGANSSEAILLDAGPPNFNTPPAPLGFASMLGNPFFTGEVVNGTAPYGLGTSGSGDSFGFENGGFNGPNGGGGAGGIWSPFVTVGTADVNTSTDTFNIVDHGLTTQDEVLSQQEGTLPSPLVDATSYFVIRTDDDNFQLATTFANAGTGTQIDITDVGTGDNNFASQEDAGDGGNAVANSGGGGGGGGLINSGSGATPGDGGIGGSGFLEVTWSE